MGCGGYVGLRPSVLYCDSVLDKGQGSLLALIPSSGAVWICALTCREGDLISAHGNVSVSIASHGVVCAMLVSVGSRSIQHSFRE
jgi:hypothetical protein